MFIDEETLPDYLQIRPFPKRLEINTPYKRFGDNTRYSTITVFFRQDGDATLMITECPYNDDKEPLATACVDFRAAFGGSQSEPVYRALVLLAEAIAICNEQQPQHRD